MSNYSWATNTQKLRRIIDTKPNATEEELKAEYVKQGGLIDNNFTEEEVKTLTETATKIDILAPSPFIETPNGLTIKKKTTAKKVKDAVVKAVKKVTKKK